MRRCPRFRPSYESHHYALLPWHEWRQDLSRPPRLLSIDFHTDTHPAFQHYAFYVRDPSPLRRKPHSEQDRTDRLAQLSPDDAASVDAAVLDLRHDEHIDAAIQCGILDAAFILAHNFNNSLEPKEVTCWKARNLNLLAPFQEPRPQPPFTYEIPQNRIILLGDDTPLIGDDARHRSRSQILEAKVLRARLANADDICRSANVGLLLSAPFVLDIDLDSFNTRQAIAPRDPSTFYELIRRAHAITIAQEPECVDICQMEGEELAAPWLEQQLLAHIERALS
jgi:hypothetical protein